MNFIAHLYLSGTNEGLLVGNFIADAVKGRAQLETYPEQIRKGIVLHRRIDNFTDTHPVARASKYLLVAKYNHFAGVLVDIFYDYLLTNSWGQYSDESLTDFSERCVGVLEKNINHIPEKMKLFLRYTKMYDTINSYNTTTTISNVLSGMSKRTAFNSNMEAATEDLILHAKVLQQHFEVFFPDLQNFVTHEIANN